MVSTPLMLNVWAFKTTYCIKKATTCPNLFIYRPTPTAGERSSRCRLKLSSLSLEHNGTLICRTNEFINNINFNTQQIIQTWHINPDNSPTLNIYSKFWFFVKITIIQNINLQELYTDIDVNITVDFCKLKDSMRIINFCSIAILVANGMRCEFDNCASCLRIVFYNRGSDYTSGSS